MTCFSSETGQGGTVCKERQATRSFAESEGTTEKKVTVGRKKKELEQ